MRILFFDAGGWSYRVETPRLEPLGGSVSALCYLAEALAALGHEITIANESREPVLDRGVRVSPKSAITNHFMATQHAIVVINGAIGQAVRALLPRGPGQPPLIFWNPHDLNQSGVKPLTAAAERDAWDGFAMVSHWQAARFAEEMAIPRAKIRILRNGAAPDFCASPLPASRPLPDPAVGPVLVYSSTPFRGLDLLLDAFPPIRHALPRAELRIYSSMAVYRMSEERELYLQLYERAKAMAGVRYVGSLGQSALAAAMAEADLFAYPSTFAETSCIAAIEAMAAGALPVTTGWGALPETLAGFGQLTPPYKTGRRAETAAAFAEAAIAAWVRALADPAGHRARQSEQMRFFRAAHGWAHLAGQWLEAIEAWRASLGAGGARTLSASAAAS